MPRTKQIHPRNLRDKIEEAQKELNGAEVSKKELLEAGIKGTSESLKGVKRKKIVAENHLKKIPKSPLRNPLQAKHRQNTEDSPFAVLAGAAEPHKKQSHSPAKAAGRPPTKHNGETPGLTAGAPKPEAPVCPRKPPFLPQQPTEPRRWRSEGPDPAKAGVPEGKRDPGSPPSKGKAERSEGPVSSGRSSPPSSFANTAFDVLLKAMEPELNTLSQKGSPCAAKIEKLRPNKTARALAHPHGDPQEAPDAHLLDAAAPSQPQPQPQPPRTSYPSGPVSAAQRKDPAAVPAASPAYHIHELPVPKPSPQSQQLPACSGFAPPLASLQIQENAQLEHVYTAAATSLPGRTQVTPPNQQVDAASPVPVSPAPSTQSPPTPIYNSSPVAAVVNHSVEQMCSLLLKDQKPKKQGKYICEYCNRACAKPSVLLKHIRSHTGERPYPCVTCGFSFKTKSNLYKHKKSHAHTIKLGLVLQPDAGGLFVSHESPKALSIHSDVEDSGDSEEDGAGDERPNDPGSMDLQPAQMIRMLSSSEALPKSGSIPSNPERVVGGDFAPQDGSSESQAAAELPKVVVHPISVSPLRVDSPKVTDSKPELPGAQKDLQGTRVLSHPSWVSSLEADEKAHQKGDPSQPDGKPESPVGTAHAQLQRQQATDYCQEQQGKLLSPRSLGSTDSGYFSRSESADQTVSPPTPFARTLPAPEQDSAKNSGPSTPRGSTPAASAVPAGEKAPLLPGQMRPPLATKTLEERISKLISDNEALVDDKQLDSVKPRRTSLSRRGSIDSPKSYIFKDSFQFDLKPMGRRTSSSSDIPKSPFTPTEKSKQVFLLSVPSLDCLPITRSNSMPTTGYSAVPASIIPAPHPLRGSQSFDDKIGAFYDDVFVPGPNPSVTQSGHPRTLVRQAAVEDSSASENHVLGAGQPWEESHAGGSPAGETAAPRSKPPAPGSHLEKKKSHQGRGTMFECETCRNRYRKLENFENHKKFYCSELHGPKTKVAVRDPDHSPVPGGAQTPILHYRVAGATGVWEQTPQIRKRRKMKSVGDDDELQQNESGAPPKSSEGSRSQSTLGPAPSLSQQNLALPGELQPRNLQRQATQLQRGPRGPDQPRDPKPSFVLEEPMSSAAQDRAEPKRHGAGISVIQHTNSLGRPGAFDKLEAGEGASPVSFQELRTGKPGSLSVRGISQEEGHPPRHTSQPHQPALSDAPRGELQDGSRKISGERHMLGQPSRLVRQHSIQVPEILVTEEPDRDLEGQGHDPEKSEKFSWPQRSETLSKLPTEKLPPKKKRLRLAEMEHSSAESSFDSTLSRSLSRDSSLSHTSSFSASLDVEDVSKTEASPKIDFLHKADFLLIPAGSNTLSVPGGHREMRRAASEQIHCLQTSMEVSDFRSKSFDCGSIAPSRKTPPAESHPPTSPSGVGVAGHVPLLERRRGPLIRQISLNIAPENPLAPGNPLSFQTVARPAVSTVPLQGLQLTHPVSAEFPANTLHSQTPVEDVRAETASSRSPNLFPVQQLLGIHLLNPIHVPLSHPETQMSLQVSSTQSVKPDASPDGCVPSQSEDCFAPKYQLQCPTVTSSQPCASNPVQPLPKQVLSDPAGAAPRATSLTLPAKLAEATSNSCPPPPLKVGALGGQVPKVPTSLTLSTHLQTQVPAYCFAAVTPLPRILVTQDLSNQPICQANRSTVPISEEQNPVPKPQNDPRNALPNPDGELICQPVFSEMDQNPSPSESSPTTPKMSVGRLSPQQESSASSKRMLSPANSLDIAMEKHQKRAKDENGAVCATDTRPLEAGGSRAPDGSKQKKPVLVRQVCTTEPLEAVTWEQDVFPHPEVNTEALHLTDVSPADNLSSGHCKPVAREPVKELQEFESIPSAALLTPTVGSPAVPAEKTHISPLESTDNRPERKSPGIKNPGDKANVQEQSQPAATTPSTCEAGDTQPSVSFPSLKTATSFTWCYLMRQRALHLPQTDQKTSAYTDWAVSASDPNPLGLPTKVALSLLNSKQKTGRSLYCQAITTHFKSDLLVYSSKWKSNLSKRALGNQKSTVVEFSSKDASEINSEQDKENSLIKSEPRRIKIFDGGYKSNEEYVYVRGRGRGKYICEECGIRCKKPSMLKKHIRTHTDVRPYHCTYCNFSFKTKGNLTKHMKSKTHSKKCVDLGVSVGLIDEQDTEESDEKQRFSFERSGYDPEESDGAEDDENENEEEDEDSQAESVLSAAPSAAASPQHLPARGGPRDPAGADEDASAPEGFPGGPTDPMDVLPRALPTKMTVLSALQSDRGGNPGSPGSAGPRAAGDVEVAARPPEGAPRSPCHQMSVDYPDPEEMLSGSAAGKAVALTQGPPCLSLPAPPASERSPQPGGAPPSTSPRPGPQEQKPQAALPPPAGLPSPQTHLFSHLPLHSQQQSRTPYNMVPVGGIQVVPAGLTYSTFVPIQAGPVQLTIPAVNVIHRPLGTPGDLSADVPGAASPAGVAELSSVVPCIPIGQIRVPTLQPLPALSMETVNIVGLASANLGPQVRPPGLALNAVGLQVVAANPVSQSSPAPPTPIPGLQILNIALPTLIPSVSQVPVDAQGTPEMPAPPNRSPREAPLPQPSAGAHPGGGTPSPQGSPGVQRESAQKGLDPSPARDQARRDSCSPRDAGTGAPAKPRHDAPGAPCKPASAPPPPPCRPRLPLDLEGPRPPARRPVTQFSDVSSDEDEDRLVIAT